MRVDGVAAWFEPNEGTDLSKPGECPACLIRVRIGILCQPLPASHDLPGVVADMGDGRIPDPEGEIRLLPTGDRPKHQPLLFRVEHHKPHVSGGANLPSAS